MLRSGNNTIIISFYSQPLSAHCDRKRVVESVAANKFSDACHYSDDVSITKEIYSKLLQRVPPARRRTRRDEGLPFTNWSAAMPS